MEPSLLPLLHDPTIVPAEDTSPQALGVQTDENEGSKQREDSPPPKGRVKRAVEKTVDKLGRSISGKALAQSAALPASPSSSRRMFRGMRGKGKEKTLANDINDDSDPQSRTRTPSRASRPSSPPQSPLPSTLPNDDSPFISPPSPPLRPSKPSLHAFRDMGSLRAGTQTLIQALQAIPWSDDPDNEDDIVPQLSPADSDTEDEKPEKHLASSIHTIYRPLARSRRTEGPPSSTGSNSYPTINEEANSSDGTEEELEAEDFEESTPRSNYSVKFQQSKDMMGSSPSVSEDRKGKSAVMSSRMLPIRTGSMATVRLQRRERLAEKLREVFELDGIEQVCAEMPCWLLRSVLLQGYMYLTNAYLCFFAHMPAREDQILKSGSLSKKANRTKRWVKHWFILKNDALSWYQSSSDPYFPHGIVDLRYAISCEPVNETEIRLRTNQKSILLSVDSGPSREEWVKAIRKVIFKAQNMGDSVKIAIPYSAIVDVEKSSAMDFSETIEVKVVEQDENYSVDSYFFAYFHDLPGALDKIRDIVRTYRTQPEHALPQIVMDTTVTRPSALPTHAPIDRTQSAPLPTEPVAKSGSVFRLSSLLRPFQEGISLGRTTSSHEGGLDTEDFTHISKRGNIAVTTPEAITIPSARPENIHESFSDSLTPTTSRMDHTYPPSTSPSPTNLYHLSSRESSGGSSWSVGVPSWLKNAPRKALASTSNRASTLSESKSSAGAVGVSEVYSSGLSSPGSRSNGTGDLGYSILETPDLAMDAETTEKFRVAFALDQKETLLGYFPGYIFRLLPVHGRLYISTNFFCFKSSGPLTSKTRMMLPIRDILATEKSKATRFGHHGLVVIVKGHEELFFEFGDEDRRNAFVRLLERQMDDVSRRLAAGDVPTPTQGKRDALILEEFEAKPSLNVEPDPRPPAENMADSLPAVMFTSASSTFLTFKPAESLHFTFLTIGSRGDVQPYIALAKGLLADGHRVRIATHGEFREWIESHGIEFGFVGGDPAELMRLCVENGMFTLSFMKEALQMFREWLDDLLKTSWEACQGTDVIIESPSAMGGYHIAEALRIPYFRAFTMTWTRTRAYPHAFAVPERKMGGSYNYMSYVMFDQVFWRGTSGQINRWRRNLLHLGATSLDKMEPHKIPFLYNFSPLVVPPPLDWPEWIRVTGYWFLDQADVSSKKWTPPADLVEFIESAHQQHKKVVYIGFGSIVVSDPRTMTRCVIEAVLQSGVHAILSKGWSDRLHVKIGEASEPEEPLPKQIYPITSIPHDWLFQRVDAACHHGGAGTTGASLRAGIPTIIKPFFGDQFFWADRVEALGVGSGVRKLTVDNLTEALISATTDRKQIDRAKLLGEGIRAEDGVSTAIESIYRDLEYARSLVKHTPADGGSDEELDEESTIRDNNLATVPATPERPYSGCSSGGAPSDWSVISDQDERRSSSDSRRSEIKVDRSRRRSSLAAAVLSVLPDGIAHKSSHRRTLSDSSQP